MHSYKKSREFCQKAKNRGKDAAQFHNDLDDHNQKNICMDGGSETI